MKKFLWVTLLCLTCYSMHAQETYNSSGRGGDAKYKVNQTKKGFDPNRLIFGGGLGLSFGSTTAISVSPIIGYRITDNFAAGVSLGYQYFRVNDYIPVYNYQTSGYDYYDYKSSVFSTGLWARYVFLENFFVHTEFEYNFMSFNDYYSDYNGVYSEKTKYNVPSLLLGGGYRQPVGEHLSFVVMALYDVLQDIPGNTRVDQQGNRYSLSPYADRIDFRVGVNIGF